MIEYRMKIILKKFFRNKLNYIIILLIGLCFAFSIIINSLTYSAKVYFEDNVLNFVSYRQFSIVEHGDKEELKEILNSMPEIEGVFDYYGYVSFWYFKEFHDKTSDNGLASMQLAGSASTIKAIVGEDLPTTDEQVMICPSIYYSDYDKTNKIDLSPYVGKNLTIRYIDNENPKEYSVKLIGLFDNDKLKQDYRTCYMNYKALEQINRKTDKFSEDIIYYELKNIIDEEKVTNALREKGYWPDPIIFLERGLAIESLDMLIYISYGLFALSIFIVSCIISFNISKNKNNIILNKIFGYSNKNLILNHVMEMISLFIMSVLSTIIFTFLLLILFKQYLPVYYTSFKHVKLLISPTVFFGALMTIFALCIVIGLINFILSFKSNIYKNIASERR